MRRSVATPEQLALLPHAPIRTRAAEIELGALEGHEHAQPPRELVQLIAAQGVLSPILVAPAGEGRFRVLDGRRRARAAALLEAQGRGPGRIPALVAETPQGVAQAAATLACHVRSCSPAVELDALEAIIAAGGDEAAAVAAVARQLGVPTAKVRARLRLRALIAPLRAALARGELSSGCAQAAARLPEEAQQQLAEALGRGERLTLAKVAELQASRRQASREALDERLFDEARAPWRTLVRGHLQAAAAAVPEEQAALAQAIARAAQLAAEE